jgi:hypothetical protein
MAAVYWACECHCVKFYLQSGWTSAPSPSRRMFESFLGAAGVQEMVPAAGNLIQSAFFRLATICPTCRLACRLAAMLWLSHPNVSLS